MRAVVQRVLRASVYVGEEQIAAIECGLLVLLGVAREDQQEDAAYLARKISGLRIFADPTGKMNFSVLDNKGAVLAVPQFTLLGDCRHGRRPDFTKAARSEEGATLFELFCRELKTAGLQVKKGRFQEYMHVNLVNDGPVTLILDSREK